MEWVVIGIVVVCCSAAIGLTIRERRWLKRQQSKIDEAYGWLKGYHRDEDPKP